MNHLIDSMDSLLETKHRLESALQAVNVDYYRYLDIITEAEASAHKGKLEEAKRLVQALREKNIQSSRLNRLEMLIKTKEILSK